MEGRSIPGTIDTIAYSAADGREASGMLNPEAATHYNIAPEPLVQRYDGGRPIYANTPTPHTTYHLRDQ